MTPVDTTKGGDVAEETTKNKRRSPGDGGLYQDKRGLWIGIVWVPGPDGKRKQKRVASMNKALASQKLNRLRSDALAGRIKSVGVKPQTVGEWCDHWLETIRGPLVRPRTKQSYATTIRLYIKPHIGNVRLDKLSPAHVRAMHKALQDAGSTRNAQKAQQVLKAALKQGVKDEVVAKNVCDAVDNPPHRKQKRGAFDSKLAVHILKTAAKQDDLTTGKAKLATRWAAAFMTGARQSELLGLTWDRVDLKQGTMTIDWQLQRLQYVHGCELTPDGKPSCGRQRPGWCPSKEKDLPPGFENRHCHRSLFWTRPKTEAGERTVPLAPPLLAALKVHRLLENGDNPHNLVWHHPDGRPLSQEDDNKAWNELMAAAGIEKKAREAVLHEARNTAATMLLESGVDASVIKDILGHATILQTRDYQRVSLKLSQTAVANLGELLPG